MAFASLHLCLDGFGLVELPWLQVFSLEQDVAKYSGQNRKIHQARFPWISHLQLPFGGPRSREAAISLTRQYGITSLPSAKELGRGNC